MSKDAPEGKNPHDSSTDLNKRDVRALTEVLTVLPDQPEVRGADEMFLVVSESGSQYTVDLRTRSCTCPDAVHRDPDGGCKHIRRCRLDTGRRPIPEWVNSDALADGLSVDDTRGRTMTDGGATTVSDDEPQGSADDSPDDDCQCDELPDGVPCWPCYQDGAEFGGTDR